MLNKLIVFIVFAGFLSACGTDESKTDRRSETASQAPEAEKADDTEALAGQSLAAKAKAPGTRTYSSVEGFTAAQATAKDGKKDPVAELYAKAFKKISEAFSAQKNLIVVSVAYSVSDTTGTETCAYVQIQQAKFGENAVLETLVPEGQAANCVPARKKGLGLGSIGFLVKLAGNNYAGGIGFGAVYYDGKKLAGCAAGAVGYASETAESANGTYGAFCSDVYAIK